MLIDEPAVMRPGLLLMLLTTMRGRPYATRLRQGIYEIGHFGSSDFLGGYQEYPELSICPYGVCDTVDDVLAACPELSSSSREFVITLTRVRKCDEPSDGGWRWAKWGPYVGRHQPQCEYLYDEPEIDEIFCYHVYEAQT